MKLKLQMEEGGDWGLFARRRWDQKRKMESGDEERFSKWKMRNEKQKWKMKPEDRCNGF